MDFEFETLQKELVKEIEEKVNYEIQQGVIAQLLWG
jgi:hypothetical protein